MTFLSIFIALSRRRNSNAVFNLETKSVQYYYSIVKLQNYFITIVTESGTVASKS